MKRVLIALMACSFLFACKKDNNDATPDPYNNSDESYQPTNEIISDGAVMYTNNDVIHDQALISDYITRMGYPAETPGPNDLSSYSLTFTGGNNVLRGNRKAEIISKNDTLMTIAELDYTTDNPGPRSVPDTLLDLLPKNGPLSECATYYTNPCSYRKKFPILISGGNYAIPYFVATVSTTTWRPIFGIMMPFTNKGYTAGPSMILNDSLLINKIKNNTTLTYYDDVLQREITTQRYDTIVVQIMHRPLKKQ